MQAGNSELIQQTGSDDFSDETMDMGEEEITHENTEGGEQNSEEDEFDYSDFELEDDDI